jgi:phage virion morphogenesis protein
MLRTVYDLNQITSRVNRLDKAFGVKNRRRLIKQASEDILQEIRRTFRTKASPDGEPWAKLAPKYQKYNNTQGDIGILSGLMLNSIPGKFANNSRFKMKLTSTKTATTLVMQHLLKYAEWFNDGSVGGVRSGGKGLKTQKQLFGVRVQPARPFMPDSADVDFDTLERLRFDILKEFNKRLK